MNMQVVAEGVETKEQLRTLVALGCHYAQGFYFSKPISAGAALVLMRAGGDIQKTFKRLKTENSDADERNRLSLPEVELPEAEMKDVEVPV